MNQRWKHKWLFNHQRIYLKCIADPVTCQGNGFELHRTYLKVFIHQYTRTDNWYSIAIGSNWVPGATEPVVTVLKSMSRGTNKPHGRWVIGYEENVLISHLFFCCFDTSDKISTRWEGCLLNKIILFLSFMWPPGELWSMDKVWELSQFTVWPLGRVSGWAQQSLFGFENQSSKTMAEEQVIQSSQQHVILP